VTTLESRAGAPAWGPELLSRHQLVASPTRWTALRRLEQWAPRSRESHHLPYCCSFAHPSRAELDHRPPRVLDAGPCSWAVAQHGTSSTRLCLRMGFTMFNRIALTGPGGETIRTRRCITLELPNREAVQRLADYGFPMERTAEEAWPHFKAGASTTSTPPTSSPTTSRPSLRGRHPSPPSRRRS